MLYLLIDRFHAVDSWSDGSHRTRTRSRPAKVESLKSNNFFLRPGGNSGSQFATFLVDRACKRAPFA